MMKIDIEISDEEFSRIARAAVLREFERAINDAVEKALKPSVPALARAMVGAVEKVPEVLEQLLREMALPALKEALGELGPDLRAYAERYFTENGQRVMQKVVERMAREALQEQDRKQKARR